MPNEKAESDVWSSGPANRDSDLLLDYRRLPDRSQCRIAGITPQLLVALQFDLDELPGGAR